MARLKLAVLISGRGSNLGALLDAARDPAFPAEVALVVSNRTEAAGLDLARAAGVPTVVVDHRPFKGDRAAFDAALDAVLRPAAPGLICLAGFMRVLTDGFVEGWDGRLINIHPSLLPSFRGLDTHARALAAGVRVHGCTVHYVRPELDNGPIVAQAAVPVLDSDDEEALAARVLAAEHRLYPHAVRLIAEGRVRIAGDRVSGSTVDTGALIVPPL
jgi:phosphoribosylglycinamide formyltransferase 1